MVWILSGFSKTRKYKFRSHPGSAWSGKNRISCLSLYFVSLNRFMTVCKFYYGCLCFQLYSSLRTGCEDKLIQSTQRKENTLVEKKNSCAFLYGSLWCRLSPEKRKTHAVARLTCRTDGIQTKKLKTYQKKYKVGALSKLVENDSMLQAEMNKCGVCNGDVGYIYPWI